MLRIVVRMHVGTNARTRMRDNMHSCTMLCKDTNAEKQSRNMASWWRGLASL